MEIMKAIIPAAGLGTRFHPYTKGVPKEMLPLLNKPAIHHIVQECVRSALKQVVFVTNKTKYSIAEYFDSTGKTEELLKDIAKNPLIAELRKIIQSTNFTYVHQSEPLGLGHAILSVRHIINKEYFCVLLPDDLIVSETPGIQQLMQIARQERATVIAVQEIPVESVGSYGVIAIKKQINPSLFQVSHLVEKPKITEAPSNLGIVGRYVLSSKIFQALDEVPHVEDKELQLTDGIAHMLHHNERVFAYKIQGQRYDIGTPIGWVKTLVALTLQDPQLAPQLREFLYTLDQTSIPVFNTHSSMTTSL